LRKPGLLTWTRFRALSAFAERAPRELTHLLSGSWPSHRNRRSGAFEVQCNSRCLNPIRNVRTVISRNLSFRGLRATPCIEISFWLSPTQAPMRCFSRCASSNPTDPPRLAGWKSLHRKRKPMSDVSCRAAGTAHGSKPGRSSNPLFLR